MGSLLDEILTERGFDEEAMVDYESHLELRGEDCQSFDIDSVSYLKWVQRSLNRIQGTEVVVDGKTSMNYRNAVRRFQRDHGLSPTGQVDSPTQNKLILANEADKAYVEWIQKALNKHGAGLVPDGAKTFNTRKAIRNFQKKRAPDLCADGFVGAKTELRLIQAGGGLPPGHIAKPPEPSRKKRRRKPKPSRKRVFVLRKNCKEEHRRDVEVHLRRAHRGIRLAVKRFQELKAMPESRRAKAWNSGHEKVWFGSYNRGKRKTPFRYVKRNIDRIARILIRRRPPYPAIRCDYRKDADGECTFGYVDREIRDRDYRNPMRNPPVPPPHTIYLAYCWFNRPRWLPQDEWRKIRSGTIIHEAAHLAGARRLFNAKLFKSEEIVTERAAKRLARRNAWGARVNAQNYAYYILSFL